MVCVSSRSRACRHTSCLTVSDTTIHYLRRLGGGSDALRWGSSFSGAIGEPMLLVLGGHLICMNESWLAFRLWVLPSSVPPIPHFFRSTIPCGVCVRSAGR